MQKYELDIRTSIRPAREPGMAGSSDQLSVHDEVRIDASNFTEIARILGAFHDLADNLRASEHQAAAEAAEEPPPGVSSAARAAYTAYGKTVGWVSVRGEPIPLWEGLGPNIQRAWARAALAAIEEPPF